MKTFQSMHKAHPLLFGGLEKKRWLTVVFLALVALTIGIMTWHLPLIGDDYYYLYVFRDGVADLDNELHSFFDLLASVVDHFLVVNGRFFVHLVYQFIDAILGKWCFNLLNPLFFVAYILLIVRYAVGRLSFPAIVVTVSLIMLMPIFKHFYLWMAGSINYLWASVIVFIFLIQYDRRGGRRICSSSWKILLLSFVAGSLHEGITVPIAVGLFAVSFSKLRKLRHAESLWMLVAFTVGAFICGLFTVHRAVHDDLDLQEMIDMRINQWTDIVGSLHLFYIVLVIVLVGLFFNRKQVIAVIRSNMEWVIVILTTLAVVFLAGIWYKRTAYMIEIGSLILTLRLLFSFKIKQRLISFATGTLAVLLVAFWGYLLYWSEINRQNFHYLENQLLEGNEVVILSDIKVPDFLYPYIWEWASWHERDIDIYNPDSQICVALAMYYHLDSVAFFPRHLLEDMADGNKSLDKFTDCGCYSFYVKRKKDKREIESIGYVLRPATDEEKPWWVRLTGIQREDDGEISYDAIYAVILMDDEEWIIVRKFKDLDYRLDYLEITYKENDLEKL